MYSAVTANDVYVDPVLNIDEAALLGCSGIHFARMRDAEK